jgi:hypothetical protein
MTPASLFIDIFSAIIFLSIHISFGTMFLVHKKREQETKYSLSLCIFFFLLSLSQIAHIVLSFNEPIWVIFFIRDFFTFLSALFGVHLLVLVAKNEKFV